MESIYLPKSNNSINIPSIIDLEKYLFNYQGNTRLNRLLHWIHQEQFLNETHNLFVIELLRSSNTTLFRKLIDDKILHTDGSLVKGSEQTSTSGGSNNNPFEEWFSSTEKTLQTTLNILENELLTAKSTTVKESIRIAYCELGNLYYKWGKLDDSFKSFLRSRDYCSMPKHHNDIAYHLVLLSFDMKQYYNANNFVNKLIDLSIDPNMLTKGKIIQGLLLLLNENNYYASALKFLEINEISNDEISSITSIYDIGFYTFILCLATMNYSELKHTFMSNKSFLNYYLAPSASPPTPVSDEHTGSATASASTANSGGAYNPYGSLKLKQILIDIMNNSFESLFQSLPTIYSILTMDIYFKHHTSYLMKLIIEKVFLQFLSPYQTISLQKIQDYFPQLTSIKQVKELLITLISSGKLLGKIDSTNNVLKKNVVHLEKKVIDTTHTFMKKNSVILSRGLLRTSLQRYGFLIDTDVDQPMNAGKMKRLQDLHEHKHRMGKRGGGSRGGVRHRSEGAAGGGAPVGYGDDVDDMSDREDSVDEETLMMIAQAEAQYPSQPYRQSSRGGGDDYYSGDDDM